MTSKKTSVPPISEIFKRYSRYLYLSDVVAIMLELFPDQKIKKSMVWNWTQIEGLLSGKMGSRVVVKKSDLATWLCRNRRWIGEMPELEPEEVSDRQSADDSSPAPDLAVD